MTKPKFLTQKFIVNAVRFATYFLAVIVAPYLAKPIAPYFDWAGYGFLRPMFVEIFTMIIWALIAIAITCVEVALHKAAKKRRKESALENAAQYFIKESIADEESEKKTTEESIGFHFLEKGREKELTEAEKQAFVLDCKTPPMQSEKKKKKFQIKMLQHPLPMKNVGILTLIVVACIALMTAIIGFKVKLFYDLGEDIAGHDLYIAISVIARNAVKCFWILGILCAGRDMVDELFRSANFKGKELVGWLIVGALTLLFGVYDIFTFVIEMPMAKRDVLMLVAYLLFYVAFTVIYCLTERHKVKSFLLILFIYLF